MKRLVAVLTLILVGQLSGQEESRDAWEEEQRNALTELLSDIQTEFELNDDVVNSIQSHLEKFVASIPSDERKQSTNTHPLHQIPKSVRNELYSQLRNQSIGERSKDLDDYLQVIEESIVSAKSQAIRCVVVFLDNHLMLSEKQFQEFEQVIRTDWSTHWNSRAYLMTFRSNQVGLEIIHSLDSIAARQILNESQFKVFESIDKLGADGGIMLRQAQATPNDFDFSEAQEKLDSLVVLQIEYLDRICELSEKQESKIKLAYKGALTSMKAQWVDADQSSAEDERFVTTPIVQQLMQQAIMQKTISNTLTPDQFEKYKREEKRRSQIRGESIIKYLLHYYLIRYGDTILSDQRMEDLTQRFQSKLDENQFVTFHDIALAMARHGEDILRQTLNEDEQQVIPNFVESNARYLETDADD